MNRFRTRKKVKEVDGDVEESAQVSSFFGKKAKKVEPEPKKELDLTAALPPSDDFRTSLLMPNLSARFSMLREQDDPSSMLGKANDDSVLFPKRASRLNVFGNGQNALSDIAEVSSLADSTRPSLTFFENRTDSFGSGEGYGTDEDSSSRGMMNRSRPGEGNNLFGGRQKVYKIPVREKSKVDSDADSTSGGRSMGGRLIYQNDVTLSAFQKQKMEEREQKGLELDTSQDAMLTESDGATSPSVGNFRLNRTTGSSTMSGPLNPRSSTAASSIDSQPGAFMSGTSPVLSNKPNNAFAGLERVATKSRRYGPGLDSNQNQSSALSRLESMSRQRAGSNAESSRLGLSQSKSAMNLNDKFQRFGPVYASSNYRPASPAPSPDSHSVGPEKNRVGINPSDSAAAPLSPLGSDGDDAATTFAAAVQPEDRGKATAMGLFHRPSAKYDEQQFSKRQMQMHEGRSTPPPRRREPPVPPPPPMPVMPPMPAIPAMPVTKTESPKQPFTGRPRGLSNKSNISSMSNVTHRSRAGSVTSHYSNAERQEPGEDQFAGSGRLSLSEVAKGTFLADFGSDSGSEAGEEQSDPFDAAKAVEEVHPALRPTSSGQDSVTPSLSSSRAPSRPSLDISEPRHSESRDLTTIDEVHIEQVPPSPIVEEATPQDLDSPTLGPTGLGLSGLIRSHLRHDSGQSSIYPPPSPGLPPAVMTDSPYRDPTSRLAGNNSHPVSVHSNPWEYDDLDSGNHGGRTTPPQSSAPEVSNMSARARQMLEQAAALKRQDGSPEQRGRGINGLHRAPNPVDVAPWQVELQAHHQRGGSTETQKEREEFANELAERRKKVQEKMKSFAENESRSASPVLGRATTEPGVSKAGNAFAMLRNKTNKNVQPKMDNKAMKKLGLGNNTMSASTPNLTREELWRDEEEKMVREFGRPGPRADSPGAQRTWSRQPRPQTAHQNGDDSRNSSAYRGPSPPIRSPDRTRSGSDVSARSKSRTRYRDDLGAVKETNGYGHADHPWDTPLPPSVPSSARPSIDNPDRASSAASGRYRSNSRSVMPGYFDGAKLSVQINSPAMIGLSPRPSPLTPYSANATPPLVESPDVSAVTTPVLMPPQPSASRAPTSQGLQKRAVDKTQISEPTFVSSTSNVPLVGLPAGASLSNGIHTPPIPPMNPRRRRQTTAQTILGAFKVSDKEEFPPMPPSNDEEHSTFSDDGEKRSKPTRQRLRKSSSDGGGLNARARYQATMQTSPAVPSLPRQVPMEGGMF